MQRELEPHDPLDERQFTLAVRRLADSLSYGTDSSPFLGSGIEYVQSRVYQPGDPVKSIDWRLTARTRRVHVKEYEAPKRMPVYLVVDTSASMCVSSQRLSKYAWAVQLAGGLALAALTRVSPVALVGCGERNLQGRPSLSRELLFQWLHRLRRYRLDERTALGETLRELAVVSENRSLVILLSDLHDPTALPALKLMAQAHDCLVLQLQDPAERGGLRGGLFRAEEAETGAHWVAHGRSRWTDPAETVQELKRAGIDHLLLPTDEPFVPRLRAWLHRRGALTRGTR
ncbi:MAG: hypothetical protein RJA22_876 [Verrucomicrobiota bacterium]|jgi:uncharacterized protein (DUF58 family)